MVMLGVNIDHVATLREARKEGIPDILKTARAVKKGGGDVITVHLRLDRRHIKDRDVFCLKQENILPLNLEMAADPEMVAIALKLSPASVCIVPERREELTTEGGLNVAGDRERLKKTADALKESGIEVSFFVDPIPHAIKESAEANADAVEIHTGNYANSSPKERGYELKKLKIASEEALELGLKLNAGHGLNYFNVASVARIPGVSELNIGYSIVCRSVFVGLETAVKEMKELLK